MLYTYSPEDLWLFSNISALLGARCLSQQDLLLWNGTMEKTDRTFEIALDMDENSLGTFFDDKWYSGLDDKIAWALEDLAAITN